MISSLRLTMTAGDWLVLFLLSLLWGGSFFLTKTAVGSVGPLTLVLGRVGGAAIVLTILVWASGRRLPRGYRAWAALLLLGAINVALPFALLAWAQTTIASGLAAIFNASTPLFTLLLAHAATRDERASPSRLLGVAVGFSGVAIIIGGGAIAGLFAHLLAELACLIAPLSYAAAAIFSRRWRGEDPLVVATGQLITATLIMVPLSLALEQPWRAADPGPAIWSAIAALALFCTALAYYLYFRLIARAGATNASLVTLLIPATALLLGATFLGERIAVLQLAGIVVIGLGLALIDGRPLAYLTRRATYP